MKGRVLRVTLGNPYLNIALEEALLKELKVPTLRFWRNQESVIIGRAQLAEFETDLEYCRSHSIPVVRRLTAGGTVYNGPGNMNWSFFFPRSRETGGYLFGDAKRVFSSFAKMVVEALRNCRSVARFEPPNSIIGMDGKVSGMAAYISRDAVLCHGTLLVNADLERVQRLTRPKQASPGRRYPRSRFTPVTNTGVDEVKFASELSKVSGVVGTGKLTEAERKIAGTLAEAKYETDRWNFGDPFGSDDL